MDLLFHFDKEELEAELLAYQQAVKSETLRRGEPGSKRFSNEILHLRTLRALGDEGVPCIKLLPVPWGKLREVSETNPRLLEILDVNIFLPVQPWFLIPDVLISTLMTAQDYLNRMVAQG